MEKIEILILLYATLIFATVIVLSYLAVSELDIYLTAFAIEFFIAILTTSPYSSSESRRQMVLGAIFVMIFIAVVFERVIVILK